MRRCVKYSILLYTRLVFEVSYCWTVIDAATGGSTIQYKIHKSGRSYVLQLTRIVYM